MSMRDVSPKRLNDATADEWDQVNKPAHYRVGEVEAIDYIEQQLGSGVKYYLLGNAQKYIHRHEFKGKPIEDVAKAIWYLERYKKQLEEEVGK